MVRFKKKTDKSQTNKNNKNAKTAKAVEGRTLEQLCTIGKF